MRNEPQSDHPPLEVPSRLPGDAAHAPGTVPADAAPTALSHVPTWLVLAALLATGIAGHLTHWKMPKFSQLIGQKGEQSDWCPAHNVPESQCVECRNDLIPTLTDHKWCSRHGVSQCPFCHEDVAQIVKPTAMPPGFIERAEQALRLRPRGENNPQCTLYRRRLQFASQEAVRKAGLDVDLLVAAKPIDEIVQAHGEITFNPTRVARLSSKVPGTIWRLEKQVGDEVAADEVLALVDAAEVGRAKSEFLEALAQWEFNTATQKRLAPLAADGGVAGGKLLEAQAAAAQARARLLRAQQALLNLELPISIEPLMGRSPDDAAAVVKFLGVPPGLAKDLDRQTTTSNLIPVKSPWKGVVVARDAAGREWADPNRPLYTIADTSHMWLSLGVSSEDAHYVKPGQTVHFRLAGSGQEVSGVLDWVSTTADPVTRLVTVRAQLANPYQPSSSKKGSRTGPDGESVPNDAKIHLRNGTFGTGRIVLRKENQAILVPDQAVQWDGSCHVVFVRDKNYNPNDDSPKLFYPRPVRLGAQRGGMTEILAGLVLGEVIVTKGGGVLRGELLKNNLGAG
jgi:cobalt-zinc-cadmium efflux system membrane fusion protein